VFTNLLSDLKLFRRLLSQSRTYWLHIFFILLISLIATPIALVTPLPLKIAIDNGIGTEPLPDLIDSIIPHKIERSSTGILAVSAGLIVGIVLVSQLQKLGGSILRTYVGNKLAVEFRASVFAHIQRLSLSYHDVQGTADSIYRIQYDAPAIRYIAIDGVIPFITAIVTLVSMLYVTFQVDPQLALVALTVSPVLFALALGYRKRLRKQSRDVKKLESTAMSVIAEVLPAVRIVKAFGQENREQDRYSNSAIESMKASLRLTFTEGVLGLLLSVTTAIGTAVVIFVGAQHIQSGNLTVGELLLVMGYLTQLYSPLKTISRKVASLQSHFISAERTYEILDAVPDVDERVDAKSLAKSVGAIAFFYVSFAYEEDRHVLINLQKEIPAGSQIGIVGMTGVGKSTLVSLLPRFYDPNSGRILLDNVDIREYKLVDLRKQFAIVLQDTNLFSTSVLENIAYSRPNASKVEIVNASIAANAHDFIVSLPAGYETQVGERGIRLSAGERQRIALARAFLKDAPILILDEPTSSVDIKTEAEILEAIERLMTGRTTFIISHRLSVLNNCDEVLFLKDGQLLTIDLDETTSVEEMLLYDKTETPATN
jgi:ATP-binding cassette subfamily B protein